MHGLANEAHLLIKVAAGFTWLSSLAKARQSSRSFMMGCR
jgi:hypothetical protein